MIFKVVGSQNCVFLASPCKTMQKHLEISSKNQFWITFFFCLTCFSKIVVFNLQTTFLNGKTVFFRFLADRNTFDNAYKITSNSKFSTQNVQIPYHLHPALSNSLSSSLLSRVPYLEHDTCVGLSKFEPISASFFVMIFVCICLFFGVFVS